MGNELALVVTDARGSPRAVRFAEQAAERPQLSALHVVLSDGTRLVVADELGKERATPRGFVAGLPVSTTARGKIRSCAEADLTAPISSGSHPLIGVVVLPCSASTACSLAAAALLGRQHAPVAPGRLERLNAALFTANSALSVWMSALYRLDIMVRA